MDNQQLKHHVFKKGSTTYFTASLFFPSHILQKVTTLYAFVRVADDYVDHVPAKKKEFLAFRRSFEQTLAGKENGNPIIADFVSLMKSEAFEAKWVTAFLDAMDSDLDSVKMNTLADAEQYMYGSAEVVGLMMAKILKLPHEAYHSAQLQGKAMQYINFIRDIAEDNALGRQYIPQEFLDQHGLANLQFDTTHHQPAAFNSLIKQEIDRYRTWQKEASIGYKYLTPRVRWPIQTAAAMYSWTADQIQRQPLRVFQQKIKPKKYRIIFSMLRTIASTYV